MDKVTIRLKDNEPDTLFASEHEFGEPCAQTPLPIPAELDRQGVLPAAALPQLDIALTREVKQVQDATH